MAEQVTAWKDYLGKVHATKEDAEYAEGEGRLVRLSEMFVTRMNHLTGPCCHTPEEAVRMCIGEMNEMVVLWNRMHPSG